jgi:hypothetical protein
MHHASVLSLHITLRVPCETSAFLFPLVADFVELFGVCVVWEKLHVLEDELVCPRAVVIAIAKAVEPSRFARYIYPT